MTCNIATIQEYDTNEDEKIHFVEMLDAKHDFLVGDLSEECYTQIEGLCKSQETIPGDIDGDYPVIEKDMVTVFKTFALAAVVAYVVVKIIWR